MRRIRSLDGGWDRKYASSALTGSVSISPAGERARRGDAAERREVVVGDDLGLDEALLEVGVDDAGRLRGLPALLDRPGAHLLLTRGEIGLQAEQVVGRLD